MADAFSLSVPLTNGGKFDHSLKVGELLFLLGANGTGKSSLLGRFAGSNYPKAKRISAHRQTWFNSNSLDMTPNSRNSLENTIKKQDRSDEARHTLQYPAERTAMAIFDLIDADTMLARKIAELVRSGDVAGAQAAGRLPAPLSVINELMLSSHIPIEISVEERQRLMARKNGGPLYSIAWLSDGERNAFLIAADVLTAPPGTLLLIDEPERHLHRSIISPLLTLLFQRRSDCAFIISTHELMLPIDSPAASTLLVRSCEYQGSSPSTWIVDLLPPNADLDEGLKADILGGRQKIIFIEGTQRSLDAPLYSLLFPQVSIIPKSSSRDVEHAVRGLRAAETSHWVKAWGIVDNDRRSPAEIEKLKEHGIFALSHFSVEALYYHPEIIRRVAARVATITGKDAEQAFKAAIEVAIAEAGKQREHLVLDAVERLARRAVFDALPTKEAIRSGRTVTIEVNVADLRASEQTDFDRQIKLGDLSGLLERYPLRESGALSGVASAVGLKSRGDYEAAVRTMLVEDAEAMSFLRGLFGDLVSAMSRLSSAGEGSGATVEPVPTLA